MKITHQPSTIENYTLLMSAWVTPQLKNRFLDELTPSDIHDVIYNSGRKASPNTQRTVLDIVRRILGWAVAGDRQRRSWVPTLPIFAFCGMLVWLELGLGLKIRRLFWPPKRPL